jgi:hypothetical protein
MAKTRVSSTSDGKRYGKLRQRDTALADVPVVCDVVIQSPPELRSKTRLLHACIPDCTCCAALPACYRLLLLNL